MTPPTAEVELPDPYVYSASGRPLYTAEQVRQIREQDRERYAKLCEAERVGNEPPNPEDDAYNAAIEHCAAAIRGAKP